MRDAARAFRGPGREEPDPNKYDACPCIRGCGNEDRIVYRLPEPQRDGRTALSLTPLELIDQLAAVIPPPSLHRHRYHGVLAPNAPLRAATPAY